MRFIGEDGWAAPRLKDAALKPSERTSAWRQARCLVITPAPGGDAATEARAGYLVITPPHEQVATLLRTLFHDCRLVHADFSEYNLLW